MCKKVLSIWYLELTIANPFGELTVYHIFYCVLLCVFCFIYLILDARLLKKDFVTHTLKSPCPLPYLITFPVVSQDIADWGNKVELCKFLSWKIPCSLPSLISSFTTERTIACHVN